MRVLISLALAAVVGVGLVWTAIGQGPGGVKAGAADDKVDADIMQALEKFAKAFNDKDAKAFAAAWAEKAEYLDEDDGERLEGRKAIEADFAAMFAKADQIRLEIDVAKVRRLGTEVASIEGEARVLAPRSSTTAPG
jgi:uncharacterized protein (TIGR02246 family)